MSMLLFWKIVKRSLKIIKGRPNILSFQNADKNDLIKFSPLRDVGYINHTNLLKKSASNYNQSISSLIIKKYVQNPKASFKDDLGWGRRNVGEIWNLGEFGRNNVWTLQLKVFKKLYVLHNKLKEHISGKCVLNQTLQILKVYFKIF